MCYRSKIPFESLRRQILMLFVFSSISISVIAQISEVDVYRKKADSLRKAVWAWTRPEFSVRTIPGEYGNASRVIIARHTEIMAGGKSKIAAFVSLKKNPHDIIEITRNIVKVNDKAAINDYSEMAFTRFLKTAGRYFSNTTKTYIGARVIKPGGAIKEISPDDVLFSKNESAVQEAKLAIPDLQVGDIIDYFIAKEQNLEAVGSGEIENYAFMLFDDAPIMHYSVHIQAGSQYAVEYRSYNGAPQPKEEWTDNYENVIDFVKTNIPAYSEGELWINPFKQLPIVRVNLRTVAQGTYWAVTNKRHGGGFYADPDPEDYLTLDRLVIYNLRKANQKEINANLDGKIDEYYSYLKKNKSKLATDQLVSELYYLFRYATFLNVKPNEEIAKVVSGRRKSLNTNKLIYEFCSFLKASGIDWEMVLVTPKNGPGLNEIITTNDIDWILKTTSGGEDKFFGMTDVFSPAFHLPWEYENMKRAIKVDPDAGYYKPRYIDIPESVAADNAHFESLSILPSSNGADLQVNRKTILKGHYKSEVQEKLILFEDFCDAERKLLGADKTMIQELEDSRKSRGDYATELKAVFGKERAGQKDAFIKEAQGWFDHVVTNLKDYKIENLGVRHNKPDFIYSSKFELGGLIKKAGNNMIIDIGKLQGPTINATPNLYKRKLDIYMPYPRSIESQISLQIPEGYTAEGITELNKKIENKAGHFIVEATTDEKTIKISIRKAYNHAYESIGNWDQLVVFIEAADEWTNSKILLKKK
jgi:hypothetical protein